MSMLKVCAFCGVDACPSRCRCKGVSYCNSECALAHWAQHQDECSVHMRKQLKKLVAEKGEGHGDVAIARCMLGIVLCKQGVYHKAIQYLLLSYTTLSDPYSLTYLCAAEEKAGRYDEALEHLQIREQILLDQGGTRELVLVYSAMGRINWIRGNVVSSKEFYAKCLDFAKQAGIDF
jgi:tetratricopeptide (TPR) repeat protein